MTNQYIQYRKAVEEARHNREMEGLEKSGQEVTKRGQVIKAVTDVIGAASRMKGSSIGGRKYSNRDGNDVNWWRVPEVIPAGTRITSLYPLSRMVDAQGKANPINLTGEIIIPFMPTIGGVKQQIYLNQTLDQLFQRARQDNTSAPAYTRADQGKLLLAFDSIYTMIEHAKTCLRILRNFDEDNRLHTWRLLEAIKRAVSNYDASSYVTNIAAVDSTILDEAADALPGWRSRLNSIIESINKWNIPNCFPFMINHLWMVSRIFAEEPSRFSEEYVFVPRAYYFYDEETSELHLTSLGVGSSGTIVDYINTLIGAIADAYRHIADQDFAQLVTGDFAKPKMFGTEDSHYVRLPSITETDEQPVTYDPEALSRIRHMSFVDPTNIFDGTARMNIYQWDIFEDSRGQIHSGIGHFRNDGELYDEVSFLHAYCEKTGDAMEGFTRNVTYIIGCKTNSQVAMYSVAVPAEGEPAIPTMLTPKFYETRGLILSGDKQVSEDEVLLATRGQYVVGGAKFELEYRAIASNVYYREGINGLGIIDIGTELYFNPLIMRFSTENGYYQFCTARGFADVKSVSTSIEGMGFYTLAATITHAAHAPAIRVYNHSGLSYSGGYIFHCGSYLAVERHQGLGDWLVPTDSSFTYTDILGEVENVIWLPDDNISWCHISACQRAFTPNF